MTDKKRALRFDANLVGDIIPVEYPINLMIAAAWYTATHRPNSIMVYNSTTGHQNPMTWGRFKVRVARFSFNIFFSPPSKVSGFLRKPRVRRTRPVRVRVADHGVLISGRFSFCYVCVCVSVCVCVCIRHAATSASSNIRPATPCGTRARRSTSTTLCTRSTPSSTTRCRPSCSTWSPDSPEDVPKWFAIASDDLSCGPERHQ